MLPLVSTRLADIWKGLCWTSPLVALLIFYGMARLAARRIERSWIDQPPTLRQVERFQRFCTPLFRRRFQHKMRRTLEWNPIAWLQQYSWKAGAAKWGLCLAVIVIERLVAFSVRDGSAFLTGQILLLAVLGSVYIFVGVNSFLEEKRSGALELLLVTPIPVNTIIFGRMWGLWKQFGPAALVVTAAVWFQMRTLETRGVLPYPTPILFTPFGRLVVLCNFLTLPVFATYAALRVKNLLAAAGLTLIGAMLPLAFARNAAIWAHCGPQDFACLLTIALGYGGFAALACFLLRHSLSRRIYSF
jgi:hypothetical protein